VKNSYPKLSQNLVDEEISRKGLVAPEMAPLLGCLEPIVFLRNSLKVLYLSFIP
jgi:hypothetical protein